MPAILDVAIGTVFVFLLFSLVLTALNEYLLSLFDERAKFLRMGLAEIFGKTMKPAIIGKSMKPAGFGFFNGYPELAAEGEKLLAHGLINGFSRPGSGFPSPSYIPAGAFVTALLDIVADGGTPATGGPITAATNFLKALQAARPAADAKLDPALFNQTLSDFLTAYGALATAPAPGSPLAKLKDQVTDLQARAKIQSDLLAPSVDSLASATAYIEALPDATAKAELTPLAAPADAALATFQDSVKNWYSPDQSRDALDAAATSAIAPLVASAAFHTAESIKAGIDNLPEGKLREGLISLYRSVDGDMQRFKAAVEGWFNGVMDRVSGWYKHFAQKWMVVMAFILAAIINVDTVDVVRVLSNNPNLAKAVADGAATYVGENDKPRTKEELAARHEKALQDLSAADAELKLLRAPGSNPDPIALKTAEEKLKKARSEVAGFEAYETAVAKLAGTGIPIGWTPEVSERLGWKGVMHLDSINLNVLLSMIAGWGLTAIAASIGAPFWFDLLGRFVNIRAAGRAPGEKEAASTPSKPPLVSLDTNQSVAPASTT